MSVGLFTNVTGLERKNWRSGFGYLLPGHDELVI